MAVVRYKAAVPTEPGITFWKDGPGSLSPESERSFEGSKHKRCCLRC